MSSSSVAKQSEKVSCPECGSLKMITDSHRGELICGECGCVVEERIILDAPEWRAYNTDDHNKRSRVGSPLSVSIHDKGLATTIGYENRDVFGRRMSAALSMKYSRLRKWQTRLRAPRSLDRSFVQAFTELERLVSQLGLPKTVQETAAMIYREATRKSLIRGRSIESMAAASIYAACRIRRIPRTLEEIAANSRVSRKELGRCFRILLQELKLKVPPVDPVDYVLRYGSDLRMNGRTVKCAIKLLREARKHGLTGGKDPSGLAAATLYIAGIMENDRRAQRQIAVTATVTEVTIRNRYKEIVEKFHMEIE